MSVGSPSADETILDTASSGSSITPTVNEEAESDGGDDCVMVEPPPVPQLPPLLFWGARIARFNTVLASAEREDRIKWNLGGVDFEEQLAHCIGCVDARLLAGYILGFKIGITHTPYERFLDKRYGYARLGYKEMVIIGVHDTPQFICELECQLLGRYRRYDRRGVLVNLTGHPLCWNKAPGGESGNHCISPFFCYMAIG